MIEENEIYEKKTELPISVLKEDPLNEEAFFMTDPTPLCDSIKADGFFGEIVVYPIENGMYMIESGHRRKRAAEMAGLTTVKVSIVDPPQNEIERRIRIARWNLHTRPSTPIGMGKLAEYLTDTYKMKYIQDKANGIEPTPVLEKVASLMECSTANVTKYKALLRLNETLQAYIEEGICPWVAMLQATKLDEVQQNALISRIRGRIKLGGNVTGEWLKQEINQISCMKFFGSIYEFDRDDLSYYSDDLKEQLKETRYKEQTKRKKDGKKNVVKAFGYLEIALSEQSKISKRDMPYVVEYINEIYRLSRDYLIKNDALHED